MLSLFGGIQNNHPNYLGRTTTPCNPIQTHCKAMGVKCDISPNFHPEVAGEEIEYSWGNAKMVFRRIPLKNRKSVADFRLQVKRVLSKEVLSIDRAQNKF